MAKKIVEKEIEKTEEVQEAPVIKKSEIIEDDAPVSCLRKERICVKFIPRENNNVTNPKHVLYGGMAETSKRVFVVPKLRTGQFVNVLTDKEKEFLEDYLGLEHNALSVYKRENNFWSDINPAGVNKVILNKSDNYLDLSDAADYIRYKILLANKDYIASSLEEWQEHPKATYQFVLVSEDAENEQETAKMTNIMKCYKEYGKIETNIDALRFLVETLEGKPTSANTKIAFLQSKINQHMQADPKLFLKLVTDPYLESKILIRKSIEAGTIYKRGDFYYLRNGNTPMCGPNEDPTLKMAAKYLNAPKNQETKFMLEAALKQ